MMEFKARSKMLMSEPREKGERIRGDHSIESALIQATSKGYTIDMILGNHDRKPRQGRSLEQDEKTSGNLSDNEGTVMKWMDIKEFMLKLIVHSY